MTTTVTSKGQTIVPKPLRKQLNISPGTVLEWTAEGQTLRVVKLKRSQTNGKAGGRKPCTGGELAAALRKWHKGLTQKDHIEIATGIQKARRRMNREHLH
jgi:AbrB family looped-hinge helix DNA binding protein